MQRSTHKIHILTHTSKIIVNQLVSDDNKNEMKLSEIIMYKLW